MSSLRRTTSLNPFRRTHAAVNLPETVDAIPIESMCALLRGSQTDVIESISDTTYSGEDLG